MLGVLFDGIAYGSLLFLVSLGLSVTMGLMNFVNPGLFLLNAGLDASLTPKVTGFANVNFLRFHRTEVLERLMLFFQFRKVRLHRHQSCLLNQWLPV